MSDEVGFGEDELAEPDCVGDQLIIERNKITKTHRADLHVHYNGFAFAIFVDRSIPVHRRDEVIIVADTDQIAHGVVADAKQYEQSTEFFAVPELALMRE